MTGSLLVAGFIIGAAVVGARALSQRLELPYPVFLVIAGAAVSFLPGIPVLRLEPRVVFLGFLPPLVYHAGLVTSPRELRANAMPIGLGALGLVLATTFAVAGAAWAATPSLGWGAAFVLGAVVAPTDPVAATSVFNRLGGPPKMTAILEGEGLVNDGVALALFALGVSALSSPTSLGAGLLAFVKVAGGGTGFGLAVGWLAARVRRPLRDPSSQIVVSLLLPYVAYLPADALGLSGVLATLTTGLVLSQQPVAGLEPSGRIRVAEFWEVLVFLLESVLFVLVGVQLRRIVDAISVYPPSDIALVAGLSVTVVIAIRMIWWAAVPTLRWRPEGRILDTGAVPWQQRALLGWSGLRGAISLAAALSVPTAIDGRSFPARDLIIFAAFCVIAVSLIGQGATLPWLLRRLSLADNETTRHQHLLADRRCAEAALRRLDQLVADQTISEAVAETARGLYERRLERARDNPSGQPETHGGQLPLVAVQHQLLAAQHEVLRELHRRGEISFAVMRQVRRELDLEQASLEP